MIRKPVVQHLIFWATYFLFNVLRWGLFYDDFHYSLVTNLVEFSIHIPLTYLNLYYVLPRLFPKKIFSYVIAVLVLMGFFSVLRMLLTYQFVTTEILPEFDIPRLHLFDPNYFIAMFIGEFYVVGFTTAIKLGMDYISSTRQRKELEHQKIEADLAFLRSQIQPHFFFNTLNNLYSLALHKSKKTPDTILKLSDLMSYVIYKGKSKRVKLEEEVKHIHDFLDLEKLRFGERLDVEIEIFGSMDNRYIPPLILVPFVENPFKHGNTSDSKIPVHVKIKIEDYKLIFVVKNQIAEKENKYEERKGVGIKNVKKRLNILFPNNYQLSLDKQDITHTSSLIMPLYDKLSDN